MLPKYRNQIDSDSKMEELEYYFHVKDNDKIEIKCQCHCEVGIPIYSKEKKMFSFSRKEFWTTSLTGGLLGCGKNGGNLL